MEYDQAEFYYNLLSQTPHDVTRFQSIGLAVSLPYALSYSEELNMRDECLTLCTKVSHSCALSNTTAHSKYFYDVLWDFHRH